MTLRVPVALGDRAYEVVVGPGAIGELATVFAGRSRVAIVSQAAVAAAHAPAVAAALDAAGSDHEMFVMGDGEVAKSLATVDDLCSRFATWGLLRGDAIVALGGGVVGDVAGFAASVYHRGIDVVQVPTTLLAMVDSAIGGKTGVNLRQGKNLVGAFHQPRAVLADPAVLDTLSDREFRCGLGEVAKYALMGDAELLAAVQADREAILARDAAALARVIGRSAAIKADYVAADEFERLGRRVHLNYGHTLAHAIETVAEHALGHGEAVAIGLVFAGALAGALERIDSAAVATHERVVAGLGLPVRAPGGLALGGLVPGGVARADLLTVMGRDKKAAGGLTFVLAGPRGLERVDDPPIAALDVAFAAVGITR